MKPLSPRELTEHPACRSLILHGAAPFRVPEECYTEIESLLQAEQWIADPSGIYREIPAWAQATPLEGVNQEAREADLRAQLDARTPRPYSVAVERLMRSVLGEDWACDARGRAMAANSIHVWNGAENLGWHWDGPEKSAFFLLMYFTDDAQWPPERGGQLLVGRRELYKGCPDFPSDEEVEVWCNVPPARRMAVLCSNKSPMFVHKVEPLIAGVNRKVLLATLDWVAEAR